MDLTKGRPEIIVGVIDGPVVLDHPDLAGQRIRAIEGQHSPACLKTHTPACVHGTFITGMLGAKRDSVVVPAICPDCTFLVRPIFSEATKSNIPSATATELAAAIVDVVNAGARVVNLSVALAQPSVSGEQQLEAALNFAARRGVITVVAAGNQGTVESSSLTRHPWVLPVIACDYAGRPMLESNLGSSIGRRGLSAPGENIVSLGSDGNPFTLSGTSAATPFVTGATALLWSEFPRASAAVVKVAMAGSSSPRRSSIAPPRLNAWTADRTLAAFAH